MNQPTDNLKIQFARLKEDWSNVNTKPKTDSDDRHTYGAGCSWNGPIAAVKSNGGLPRCPHCNGMLFEMLSSEWRESAKTYSKEKDDRDYPAFMEWLSTRGTCSPLRNDSDLRKLRMEFVSLHLI